MSKEYFDRVSERWDTMRASFFSESIRELAVSASGAKAGELAGDIGAGSGFITEGLVTRGLSVISVDQSEAMLHELKRKLASAGTVDCRIGDALALPILNDSVDHAFSNMCLHPVDNPSRSVKEMARVVKPGGKVVIADLVEHDFEFLKDECHDHWLGFKKESVRRWFKAAGLTGVSVQSTRERCLSSSSCGHCRANVGIFLAVGEKRSFLFDSFKNPTNHVDSVSRSPLRWSSGGPEQSFYMTITLCSFALLSR